MNMCPEAVHPCGPAEMAHEYYCYYYKHYCYYQYYTWIICVHDRSMYVIQMPLEATLLSMNKLCPEAVHPRGPAEGAHHQYDYRYYC